MEIGIIIISVAVILILLAMRAPVFIALFSGSAVYFISTPDIPSQIIAQRAIVSFQKYGCIS